jgi:heme-degrading monooxygenase HmoA
MPVMPDLPWTSKEIGDGPGVVYVTHLHLRRLRDVPAFMKDSGAIRRQVMASPGARSMSLRAQPLRRRFTTVSWWDDEPSARAFVRTDPHRASMKRWRPEMLDFSNRAFPGTAGGAPTVAAAVARAAREA